jgi:hypothetical protein
MQAEQAARRSRDRARPGAHRRGHQDTQIIAIYGKGGIGKSFTLANLSYMMAQQGKKVLLIGCDPKSDTTSCCSAARPARPSSRPPQEEAGRRSGGIGDVCFKRDGVYAMELGGPEVGRGCGGRGIIHGFETLEKLGFHDWGFDYVLLDFLGDVVCGGFGLPIARDMCQKVIVVASNDLQSCTWPTTCAARSSTSASSAATSAWPAWSSTRTTAPARPRPLPTTPASRCWPPSRPTTTSAARAPATRSSAARHALGPAVRGTGHQRGRGAAGAPRRRRRTSCWACSRPR